MRALTLVHRWLGIVCAPLFAMWFASGIVMHFVPFPALTEAERLAGSGPIDFARVRHDPGDAVAASRLTAISRVRLVQRSDGPAFVLSGNAGLAALHADDLTPAGVHTDSLALAIAVDHARRRRLDASAATSAGSAAYDQWTVAGGLSPHRPLYRVTLNDRAGTELYVSSATGEVVRDTTRRERWWNYAGSVAHWIYPATLRAKQDAWTVVVWVLSAVASLAALAGVALGLTLLVARRGLVKPAGSWHAWHHALGLACAAFVLTWIVSGWLSLDSGLLFSTGKLTEAEASALTPAPDWRALPPDRPDWTSGAREVEWVFFGARPYRRDRIDLDVQRLHALTPGSATLPRDSFLTLAEVAAVGRRLSGTCGTAAIDVATDAYASASAVPGAPVYRIACGGLWFHVDAASGAIIDRLDGSRRAHRWLFGALHTFDFPWLAARPDLRGALVVVLCGCGLALSVTGCVIAWRRLRRRVEDPGAMSGGGQM